VLDLSAELLKDTLRPPPSQMRRGAAAPPGCQSLRSSRPLDCALRGRGCRVAALRRLRYHRPRHGHEGSGPLREDRVRPGQGLPDRVRHHTTASPSSTSAATRDRNFKRLLPFVAHIRSATPRRKESLAAAALVLLVDRIRSLTGPDPAGARSNARRSIWGLDGLRSSCDFERFLSRSTASDGLGTAEELNPIALG
jgi:hypothetical protein